jgi:L-ribulose-5-phosphate 4-epimerase
MLEALRKQVLDANLELVNRGLVLHTFGNASAISRQDGLVVIKPSGVDYSGMKPEHLVVTDLEGRVVEGDLKPSSDLPTHLALYKEFRAVGAVVHTHLHYATVWAQACREIPCLGTTHSDYFHGPIPLTPHMEASEIAGDYEANTGQMIIRRFEQLDPATMPAVLVGGHGPFCWGPAVEAAVQNAVMLEEVARMAFHTSLLNPACEPVPEALRDKHYRRKHGPKAYYGQPPL